MKFKPAQFFPSRLIAHYQLQLEQQKRALQRIRDVLPAPLANHALHCVVNAGKLLLYTDAAAWASQLRFYHGAIMSAINANNNKPVEIVQIRVLTEKTGVDNETSRKASLPSADNIAMIRNHSDTVSDLQLRLALQRLSATLARLSG